MVARTGADTAMTEPTAENVWRDRTLAALADLPADLPPAGPSIEAAQFDAARTEAALIEQVAVRFADRFRPGDREYPLTADHPRWHDLVRAALAALRADGLVDDGGGAHRHRPRAGRRRGAGRRAGPPGPQPEPVAPGEQPLLVPGVIAAPLRDRRARARIFRRADEDPGAGDGRDQPAVRGRRRTRRSPGSTGCGGA